MGNSDSSGSAPRVVINGRFLTQSVTGVQRYAREVVQALDELLARSDSDTPGVTLLAPRGAPMPALRHIAVRHVGRMQGHPWEQLELPWHSRGQLLWSLASTGPLFVKHQVITIHDAAVVRMPDTYSAAFRLWYRIVMGRLGPRLPLVMSVSRFSAGEAQDCFGVQADRLRVSLEGWQHMQRTMPDDSVIAQHGLAARPFVLAVSSPTPNKNFQAIVKALALMGDQAPTCVVVGATDGSVFRGAQPLTALHHVGRVSDAALLALYRHASCFVFPSFYEGFGLPPLEALAQGCPVVASTAPAVREVCGDAALYFSPHEPAELAQQLRRLLASPTLQAEMSMAGRRRAAEFSWHSAASTHLLAMADLLRATQDATRTMAPLQQEST